MTEELVKNGIVKEEDREFFSFGLRHTVISMFSFFSVLGLGIFMGMVIQTIVFSLGFIFVSLWQN